MSRPQDDPLNELIRHCYSLTLYPLLLHYALTLQSLIFHRLRSLCLIG
jgi:hypothetical protein